MCNRKPVEDAKEWRSLKQLALEISYRFLEALGIADAPFSFPHSRLARVNC